MQILQPAGWAPPVGYSNGVATEPGRVVFVAGQVGWDRDQVFHSEELAPQFSQALANVLAILTEAGGGPADIARMTCFCCDRQAYLDARRELGGIWRDHMGNHYPAMSMIFVADLLDHPAKIEIEATAVIRARADEGQAGRPQENA